MMLLFVGSISFAQMGEKRIKIEMVIQYNGKPINAELNSVSTSVTRYLDSKPEIPADKASKDSTSKAQTVYSASATTDSFYLNMDAQRFSTDLLKVFADKSKTFSGTITITDLFGKNPVKNIKFTDASLYSFSEPTYYNDNYGSSAAAILCKELTIDGVVFK